MADGRLGVLDFGAVVPMPGGLPESFGHLISAMRSDDPDVVRDRLGAGGPGQTRHRSRYRGADGFPIPVQ